MLVKCTNKQFNVIISFENFFVLSGLFFQAAAAWSSSLFWLQLLRIASDKRKAINLGPLCGRCSEMGLLMVFPASPGVSTVNRWAGDAQPSSAGPACRNANRFTPPAALCRCRSIRARILYTPYRVAGVYLISDVCVGLYLLYMSGASRTRM